MTKTRTAATLLFLLPILFLAQHAAAQNTRGALLEPADGRIYHGVQHMTFATGPDPIAGYLSALNDNTIQPAVQGFFFSIPGTRGPALGLRQMATFFKSADSIGFIPEISLFFVSDVAVDSVIAVSDQYDWIIDSVITLSKAYGRAMLLRIGGEFNGAGPGWNGGGYHPYLYVTMFRKIVDRFAARGLRDSIATIWCYYPSAANDFDSVDTRGARWYPGDEYVDWFGLDLFDVQDFDPAAPEYQRGVITRKGKSERFLAMARSKGRPVYMSETSAKGINISADPTDSQNDWNGWFVKFWQFMTDHREIKGFSYIDALWPDRAYPGWGDARIENSPVLSALYREEMHKPRYIHLPSGTTGSDDTPVVPAHTLVLEQNTPNPFRDVTTVRFSIAAGTRAEFAVHDMLGRRLVLPVQKYFEEGAHSVRLHAADLPSGLYVVSLRSDVASVQRTMLLSR
ncbi:MAG: T9SS type A sorting domain-containing protein [Ignavibacteriae bacterium]|nr:T9SS type A sorting domain-containing protein [Ignavibacteriota bacterium]